MVSSPAIALLYPSLLAYFATNPNYTIFVDDREILYAINATEPEFTQAEIAEMEESALGTTFYLYTRDNPQNGQQLFIDDLDSVKNSSWNPDNPTRLITHGWNGDIDTSSCTSIRDAYLNIGDYNVVLIDWRETAGNINYWEVANNVPRVAARVSFLLDFLEIEAGLDPTRTKLIGHSLGGHVVGLAARFALSDIAEVIALDPAKPAFDSKGPGGRVDCSDASLVHVMHTSLLGLDQAIGIADFYPNGGKKQPGCPNDLFGVCAHSRSYQYYAESVTNPKGFRAGNVFMGGPSLDPDARGNYVLETASESPFALG